MRGDIHLLPIGDLVEHVERDDCWCAPVVEAINECRLITHDPADNRLDDETFIAKIDGQITEEIGKLMAKLLWRRRD